jgi:hypothetical protein
MTEPIDLFHSRHLKTLHRKKQLESVLSKYKLGPHNYLGSGADATAFTYGTNDTEIAKLCSLKIRFFREFKVNPYQFQKRIQLLTPFLAPVNAVLEVMPEYFLYTQPKCRDCQIGVRKTASPYFVISVWQIATFMVAKNQIVSDLGPQNFGGLPINNFPDYSQIVLFDYHSLRRIWRGSVANGDMVIINPDWSYRLIYNLGLYCEALNLKNNKDIADVLQSLQGQNIYHCLKKMLNVIKILMEKYRESMAKCEFQVLTQRYELIPKKL